MSTLIDIGLQSYLSTALGQTVYPGYVPLTVTTCPQFVYTMIYQQPLYTTTRAAGLVFAEYQIDVYGTGSMTVEYAVESLRQALEGYRGLMGSVNVTGVRYIDSSQIDSTPPDSRDDQWTFRTMTEWRIAYTESIPTF